MLRNKWFWFGTTLLVGAASSFHFMVRQVTDHPQGAAAKMLRWSHRLASPYDGCVVAATTRRTPVWTTEAPAPCQACPNQTRQGNAFVDAARPVQVAEFVEVVEPITVEPPVTVEPEHAQTLECPNLDGTEQCEPWFDGWRFHPVTQTRVPRMPYADEEVEPEANDPWFFPWFWLGMDDMMQRFTEKARQATEGDEESETPVVPPVYDHDHPQHCPYSGRCYTPSHYRRYEVPSTQPSMPPAQDMPK